MTDREKLLELLDSMFNGDCCIDKADAVEHLIANGVTVPVRCKNCRSRNHDGEGKPWCDVHMMPLNDLDFFCRDGKPKA